MGAKADGSDGAKADGSMEQQQTALTEPKQMALRLSRKADGSDGAKADGSEGARAVGSEGAKGAPLLPEQKLLCMFVRLSFVLLRGHDLTPGRSDCGARAVCSSGAKADCSEGAKAEGSVGAQPVGSDGAKRDGSDGTKAGGSVGAKADGSEGARAVGSEGAKAACSSSPPLGAAEESFSRQTGFLSCQRLSGVSALISASRLPVSKRHQVLPPYFGRPILAAHFWPPISGRPILVLRGLRRRNLLLLLARETALASLEKTAPAPSEINTAKA